MAKHAVPKRKTPKYRVRSRFSTFVRGVQTALKNRVNVTTCPDCGGARLSHHACPTCGKYNGRQVIDMGKKIDKITKIKA